METLCYGIRSIHITSRRVAPCCGIRSIHIVSSGNVMLWHSTDSHNGWEWHHAVAFGRFTWCRVETLCCGIRSIHITFGIVASCCGFRSIRMMPSGIFKKKCVTNFCKFLNFSRFYWKNIFFQRLRWFYVGTIAMIEFLSWCGYQLCVWLKRLM